MKALQALGSGLVGACALTLIHETARRFIPDAPRMDVLGMRAIAKPMRLADQSPPPDVQLHDSRISIRNNHISAFLVFNL